MIARILILLAVAIVAIIIIIAMRPPTFRVERSATINAPPAAVFAEVNNLHNWEAWSPWAKLDPNAKNTYSGPAEGVGADFAWDGNKNVGAGRMTITQSKPVELIAIDLQFYRPFAATNRTEFTFTPEGSGTRVTWAMSGRNGFLGKAVGLVVDCDKMCGQMFEKGLRQLNTACEAKK